MQSKLGQVAIFVIIAIVIVAAIVGVFIFRDKIFPSGGRGEFSEIYDFYEDCIEQKTLAGLDIAGMQAGYVDVPEFEPGSEHAPFSSQLDFLGIPVPYWYYVSSNGVVKEQVPALSAIERQLEDFVEREIKDCDFSDFESKGFVVEAEVGGVDVEIRDNRVDVSVDSDLSIEKDGSNSRRSSHNIRVASKFGEFYDLARKIYEKEKKEMFLENYAVDVMYNYAPVTDVELSCSPLLWNGQEVVDNLRRGLSANIAALKVDSDYYDLKNKEDEYFVVDVSADNRVDFIYDVDWPTRVEIWPAENGILKAEPVGLQKGMGIIGFCYVPYHFVYDIYYPVLIQISDGDEIFQFPVAVVVDKSVPREALPGTSIDEGISELCDYKNTNVKVYTYDSELRPVEADVDFVCLNARCNIGKTEKSGGDAVLSEKFPQCINGKVVARAEGYTTGEQIVSTNEPTTVNVMMKKIYDLDLRVFAGGRDVTDLAIVNFESEDHGVTVVYPQQEKVALAEGFYKIGVQVFGNADLRIPASSSRQCVKVPASGLLGVIGKTKEECFDIEFPEQKVENALTAGGKVEEYILESDLASGSRLELSVPSLPRPATLEQLQENYDLAEVNVLGVALK